MPKNPKPPSPSQTTVAANIRALLSHRYGADTKGQISKFRADHKHIPLSKIQRAASDGFIKLDSIDQFAQAFGIAPYQLLIKNLDVKDPQIAIPRRLVQAARQMAKDIAEGEE